MLFAVVIALIARSMQLGTYAKMIENMVSFYTGYAQVQHKNYTETHSLDESFIASESFLRELHQTAHITAIAPRLESFGLVCSDSATIGAMIVGIEPTYEAKFSKLNNRINKGCYLDNNSQGVLVAKGLAEQLMVDIGDTLIVLSQGYHGISAAGKFSVRGIVDFPSP